MGALYLFFSFTPQLQAGFQSYATNRIRISVVSVTILEFLNIGFSWARAAGGVSMVYMFFSSVKLYKICGFTDFFV